MNAVKTLPAAPRGYADVLNMREERRAPKTGMDEIRAMMRYYGLTQTDLKYKLNRGSDYISRCFTGRNSFTIEEAYTIIDLLNLPRERFCELFPPRPPVKLRKKRITLP